MAPKYRDTLYGPWSYAHSTESGAYDDTPSYLLAAGWLAPCDLVEDWGCGTGWMGRFIQGTYRGVDGAWSPWCDVQADLRTYTSDVPGAVMRHVLEHNHDWRQIAENFHASWRERAALVLFIPPQTEDMDTSGPEWQVPDLAISGPDLFEILDDGRTDITLTEIHYPPGHTIQWGWEGILLMQR